MTAKTLSQVASGSLAAVTPSDSTDLSPIARGLYLGGAGDIAVIAADDSAAVTLKAVPVGTVLPIRVKRVKSTGTTVTNLVALA